MTNQQHLQKQSLFSANSIALLEKHFLYDPTSPSGLRWKVPTAKAHYQGMIAGTINACGYYIVRLQGRNFRAHQIVLLLNNILPAEGQNEVDHIDRNPANNLLSNLRWTHRSGNLGNRRVLGKIPYRYVHENRGKYMGQYTHPRSKQQIYVGRYESPQEAYLCTLVHRLETHWIDQ